MFVLRLAPGAVFAQDYEIVSPLAEGGMGAVYVAKQLSTGKERALKVLRAEFVSDARARERFTREARVGSRIDSEHVVEVVGAGIDATTGMPWLAMELLRGEDLETFAERVGPVSARQVLEIYRQLCHGLGAAHAAGLVHRDLKPENIFLATARRVGVPFTVKVLDFGIAKIVEHTKRGGTDAVGSPMYMAPEQTEAGRGITAASDVWALGLIAFRLLTGEKYWRSATANEINAMAVLREVVFEPMEPSSVRARALGCTVNLSPAFDGWFARAVARDPGGRFESAKALLDALAPALTEANDAGSPSVFVAPLEKPHRTPRDEPRRAHVQLVSDAPADVELAATRVGPFAVPAAAQGRKVTSSPPPSEDVDTYQRRLSRGKARTAAVVTVLFSVIGAGAYRLHEKASAPGAFNGRESEPNDRAPEANILPFGAHVLGRIGQRLDAERSDRDFYRVSVPSNAGTVRLAYRALPNIAPCILVYRVGADEPTFRYCVGQAGRDLLVPALHLDPGEFLFAVLQDREQYTDGPRPPVLENISDDYRLEVAATDPPSDVEIEPNDIRAAATILKPDSTLRGTLAWMRDVDVFCADGPGSLQFSVEDRFPRPHGAVLEVTSLGGPADGMPVRVHFAAAKGAITEHDVHSPWNGPKIRDASAAPCVSLTLVRDVWSAPPLPRVAPAGDQEYTVRLDSL